MNQSLVCSKVIHYDQTEKSTLLTGSSGKSCVIEFYDNANWS